MSYEKAIRAIAHHAQSDTIGSSEWSYSDYEKYADALYAASTNPVAAVVQMDRNGANPMVHPFDTSEAASAAYDQLTSAPGPVWFAALYDPTKQTAAPYRVDETYFGGMGTTNTVRMPSRVWPWLVGLGAGGLFMFGLGRRKR